jgi:hypothetical protein
MCKDHCQVPLFGRSQVRNQILLGFGKRVHVLYNPAFKTRGSPCLGDSDFLYPSHVTNDHGNRPGEVNRVTL